MPWRGVTEMELRQEFVQLALSEGANFSKLCQRYGISRRVGYKWVSRYKEAGLAGLANQSRRPKGHPQTTVSGMEALILEVRQKKLRWGARKIRRWLVDQGNTELPAISTITSILKRRGYIEPSETYPGKWHRFERETPNELWQMDFKGHFAMTSGRCRPLTVLDDHSRFSLGLQACARETKETVQGHLIEIFTRYGLPQQMNVDNGPPWGSGTATRYTALGVWLIKLGIHLTFSRPYHPQTNGKIERFHRTLKEELLRYNTFRHLSEAQRYFDEWRTSYNQERPHGALGLDTPIKHYKPSCRSYQEATRPIVYDSGMEIREVNARGYILYKSCRHYLGEGFRGEHVAVRPTEKEDVMAIYFCYQKVGEIDLGQQSG